MDALGNASSSYSEVEGSKSVSSIGIGDGKMGGNLMQFCEKSNANSSSPNGRLNEEAELELAKAEMMQIREENTKLKKMLEQIELDYQSLRTCFVDIMRPQQSHATVMEETELVSLSLGRNSGEPKMDDVNRTITETGNASTLQLLNNDGLELGKDITLERSKSGCLDKSRENSSESEIVKGEEETQAEEACPPSKVLKTMRSCGDAEEAALQQSSAKRARVSVRARCDSATMSDGCQWRKYGQKVAKGNPCPRAYYRCTVAPACPVRKQVQRCMNDMSVLVTTYEGTHNHPLPVSATAMASTTSAAASMLLSGSSTSATATPPSFFQGLNFNVEGNRPTPFYFPNTSPQAFSTITLDLTTSRFSSLQTHTLPSVWGNEYLNYGTMPYNTTPINSQFYQSPYPEKGNQASSQQILTETLTRAITSDPSLRSVINAAISSVVSNSGENKSNMQQSPLQFSL